MIGKILQIGLFLFIASNLHACGDKTFQSSIIESDALGRRVLGAPQEYQSIWPEDRPLELLHASMQESRTLAWQVFAEVAGPVAYRSEWADGRHIAGNIPRFLSWYTAEDAQRLFRLALQESSREHIQKSTPLTDAQYSKAERALTLELDGMPDPLQNKLKNWMEQHPDPSPEDAAGVGGTSRVYYSPGLMKHVLQNYADLGHCFAGNERPSALGADPSCWQKPLPRSAAIVKAAWMNARSKFKSFDTGASALQALMSKDKGSWNDAAVPLATPDSILSAKVGQERLILPGFHIMTRDQEDWLWITAWWSADADKDFGEDRPDFVKALGPALGNYKICVVTRFQDETQDLDQLAEKYPDLVAAFRAAQSGNPGQSWCSNPYVEAGVDNQKTNCIGCHQFAGTDARQDSILHDSASFPAHGSRKVRSTFPTEYIWSAGFGGQSLYRIIDSNLTLYKDVPANSIKEELHP